MAARWGSPRTAPPGSEPTRWPRLVGWLLVAMVVLVVMCPDGHPPDFDGILAVTSRAYAEAGGAARIRVEWKKAYDGTPLTYALYGAVDRDPDVVDPSADALGTFPAATLAADVDPASLWKVAPPADHLSREYRFAVAARDEENLVTTSAPVAVTPSARARCGCDLAPTVEVPGHGAVPLLIDCTWTRVEGAEACHWTVRTDRPNSDPAQTDPYGSFTAELFFHPDAGASRPVVISLHGGTAYSAAGLEYGNVALAGHAVEGEGGERARGYVVIAPQLRDSIAGEVGVTPEGEEIARVEGVLAIEGFVERLTTPGAVGYQEPLAALLAADFTRVLVAGGSDGGITSAALAATPPGPLPFPHTDLTFPVVPFRDRIRAVFLMAPGGNASPHAMNLRDSPTATGGQIAVPTAVLSADMDITDGNGLAAKFYAYATVDDPDPASLELDRFYFHVHNGRDDTIPSRNAHVCLCDPRGFPEGYLCDDQIDVPVLGLPIEPTMLDHHRLLRHYVRFFADRYVRDDRTIARAALVAPWYSPAHPEPATPGGGYDDAGYPAPAVVEETGPRE